MTAIAFVVSTGGTIAMFPDRATGKLVPAQSGEAPIEMTLLPETPWNGIDVSDALAAEAR
jgi:hypothetical protein